MHGLRLAVRLEMPARADCSSAAGQCALTEAKGGLYFPHDAAIVGERCARYQYKHPSLVRGLSFVNNGGQQDVPLLDLALVAQGGAQP